MAAPVVDAIWLMLPAYVANMLATLVGGGAPVDGGRVWRDGRRVLGDGKTWRGLLLPPLLTVPIVWLLRLLADARPLGLALDGFGPSVWWIAITLALATGALLGDMLFSFLKRRRGMPPGSRWLGPDQLDFVLGAWVLGLAVATLLHGMGLTPENWFLSAWEWTSMLIAAVLTPGLHLAVNFIGFKIGAKEVPW